MHICNNRPPLLLVSPGPPQSALLLANRGQVLLELGQPKAALDQLELADEEGYPEELRPKLLGKMAVALARKGRGTEAMRLLVKAEEAVAKMEELEMEAAIKLLVKRRKEVEIAVYIEEVEEEIKEKATLTSNHSTYPSLSSSLRVSSTPGKGRHLIAIRGIIAGTVVAVDRAVKI